MEFATKDAIAWSSGFKEGEGVAEDVEWPDPEPPHVAPGSAGPGLPSPAEHPERMVTQSADRPCFEQALAPAENQSLSLHRSE